MRVVRERRPAEGITWVERGDQAKLEADEAPKSSSIANRRPQLLLGCLGPPRKEEATMLSPDPLIQNRGPVGKEEIGARDKSRACNKHKKTLTALFLFSPFQSDKSLCWGSSVPAKSSDHLRSNPTLPIVGGIRFLPIPPLLLGFIFNDSKTPHEDLRPPGKFNLPNAASHPPPIIYKLTIVPGSNRRGRRPTVCEGSRAN